MRKALFILLALLLAAPTARAGKGEPLHILAVYNLTGDLASIGKPGLEGMELAVARINRMGGLLDRRVKLVVVDAKSDPTSLAEVLTRAIEAKNPVAMAGLNDSDYAMAAAPPAMVAKVPFIAAGATDSDLPSMFGPYFFMAAYSDQAQARAVAEFASLALQAETCFLLTDQTQDFTRKLSDYFSHAYAGKGGRIIGRADFQSAPPELGAQTAAIARANATAVFVSAAPEDVVGTVSAIRASNCSAPILSGDGFDTPLLNRTPLEDAYSIYFATHCSYLQPDLAVEEFVQAYSVQFGRTPESAFAALGYDAVNLIADAVKRAGSADHSAVKNALAATRSFQGVTGTISYPEGVRVPDKPVDIIDFQNGARQFAREIQPD